MCSTFAHCLSMFTLAACRIPTALPEGADGPVQIKVISGKSHGVESPVRPLGGCWYFHITFTRDRSFRIFVSSNTLRSMMKPFTVNVAVGWTAFIYREQTCSRMKRESSLHV